MKYIFIVLIQLILFVFPALGQSINREGITLRKIVSMPQNQARPVRLNKLPNGHLVYGTLNGQIFEVIDGKAELWADDNDHLLSYLSSMDIHGNDMYICGSIIQPGDSTMIGYVYKGNISDKTWRLLAESDPYYLGLGFNDHRFSSLLVSLDGLEVYVHSGTRTNAGEIHYLEGVKGTEGLRDQPLRGKLFRLPTNEDDPVHLPVDSTLLYESGYIFSEGLRHLFAMGWGTDGYLYGASNSDRRDVGEAFYRVIQNRHYGFPWSIGGELNPLQYADYDVSTDNLAGPTINNQGYYDADPDFPIMPDDIDFVKPYYNVGPDADKFRDKQTGEILDASDLGMTLTTFSGHRSPTGLKFDRTLSLPSPYTGDGFLVSYGGGLGNDRKDLLHLKLLNEDSLSATTLISGFNSLLDVFIDKDTLYLLESGASNGSGKAIYQVSFDQVVTDIEEENQFSTFKIIPNPTSSKITLDIAGEEYINQIALFNLQGQQQEIVFDRNAREVDLSILRSGMYLAIFKFGSGQMITRRIVKF